MILLAMLPVLQASVPVQVAASEIRIAEQQEFYLPGSFAAMVTAGMVGVGASASLLLLRLQR